MCLDLWISRKTRPICSHQQPNKCFLPALVNKCFFFFFFLGGEEDVTLNKNVYDITGLLIA